VHPSSVDRLRADCAVQQEVPAGDHTIVLLRVEGLYAELATPAVGLPQWPFAAALRSPDLQERAGRVTA